MDNTDRPKGTRTVWMWWHRVAGVPTRVRDRIARWWTTRRQAALQTAPHTPSEHFRLDHGAMRTRHAHWCAFLEAKRLELELRRAAHGTDDDGEAHNEP